MYILIYIYIYIYIYILDSSAALRAASNLSTTTIIIIVVVIVTVSSIIISVDIIMNIARIFTVIAIVTVVIVVFNINLLLSHAYLSRRHLREALGAFELVFPLVIHQPPELLSSKPEGPLGAASGHCSRVPWIRTHHLGVLGSHDEPN